MLTPFQGYVLRVRRAGMRTSALTCSGDGRIGLIEDSGCRARSDIHLWKRPSPAPCEFRMDLAAGERAGLNVKRSSFFSFDIAATMMVGGSALAIRKRFSYVGGLGAPSCFRAKPPVVAAGILTAARLAQALSRSTSVPHGDQQACIDDRQGKG